MRSLCPNERTWHHLKYKLHKVYQIDPKALSTEMTVAHLVAYCTAEQSAANALAERTPVPGMVQQSAT